MTIVWAPRFGLISPAAFNWKYKQNSPSFCFVVFYRFHPLVGLLSFFCLSSLSPSMSYFLPFISCSCTSSPSCYTSPPSFLNFRSFLCFLTSFSFLDSSGCAPLCALRTYSASHPQSSSATHAQPSCSYDNQKLKFKIHPTLHTITASQQHETD